MISFMSMISQLTKPILARDKSAYLATVSPGNFFTDDFSIATLTDNKQTKIEKGQYLVLNDNRRNTDDSRKVWSH